VTYEDILPRSLLGEGLFVGRVLYRGGPAVVLFHSDGVFELSALALTMSELLELPQLASRVREFPLREPLCSLGEIEPSHGAASSAQRPRLLAPCDLQVIKACGVTFAASALERVVEERTRGKPELAAAARRAIADSLGDQFKKVAPGSAAAATL
jgi:fumarylacetoacetate (FAA) hydrolase family protein